METKNTQKSNGTGNFLKKLGILWGPKTSGTGNQYYSGIINLKEIGEDRDIPVVIFENKTQREGRNDPSLQIFLQEPRNNVPTPVAKAAPKVAPKSTPAPAPVESPVEENDVL